MMRMSNANLIEQLRELSAVKRRMLQNFDEKNEIKEAQQEELNESIETYLEKKENFKEKKAEALSELVPSVNPLATDKLQSCDVKEVKPVSAVFGLVFYATFILFVLSTIGISFPMWMAFIIVPGLLVSGVMWLLKNGEISKYFEWEQQRNDWHKKYASVTVSREEMARQYANFEKKFAKTAMEFKEFEAVENSKLEMKREAISAPYKERIEELNALLEADYAEVQRIGLVHDDYLHLLDKIIEYLETGRADDLKEALNLAIEESQKMENEAARREEAYRQEQILREQARQNMLHNQEMERMEQKRAEDARVHAAQMEAHARAQAEETKKLRRELERQGRS